MMRKFVPSVGVSFLLLFSLLFATPRTHAQTVEVLVTPAEARIETSGVGLISRVAPGELIPVLTKLLNFGSNERVDVNMFSQVINAKNDTVYASEDTIAVETTASFIKWIQIPPNAPAGRYTAKSSLRYADQLVPATTQFDFIVEPKIVGIFQSDFFFYGGITLLSSLVAGVLGHLWVRRSRKSRLAPVDYSNISQDKRLYYELIGDTILEMRQHVGDVTFQIAKQVEGFKIDEQTGRVLEISRTPSEIIAELVEGYERVFGKKGGFDSKKFRVSA